MARSKTSLTNLKLARVLDANVNRVKEGLRVVEDTMRYMMENKRLYLRLRSLRHKIDGLTRDWNQKIILGRDSHNDAGRKIKEPSRKSVRDIVISNLRRAQEGTRVLEEYSKVYFPKGSTQFKSIRYQLYIEEKEILTTL